MAVSDRPPVYLGAYALCRDLSGRLLLVRMADGRDEGRWTLPGGGVEWGEHPDAALLRELKEETGIVEVQAFRLASVYSHTYERTEDRPFAVLHHIGIVYDVTPCGTGLQFERGGSTDRCEWFSEDRVRQLPLTPLGEFAVELAWRKL